MAFIPTLQTQKADLISPGSSGLLPLAEKVHATNHYRELGAIKSSTHNLQVAIDGETYEVEEMYPAYRAVAELQGEKGAQRTTDWAWQAEQIHAVMYKKRRRQQKRARTLGWAPCSYVKCAVTL
jgi:rubrerythrin